MNKLELLQHRRAELRRDMEAGRQRAAARAADLRVQVGAAMLAASVGRLLAGRLRIGTLARVSLGILAAIGTARIFAAGSRDRRN